MFNLIKTKKTETVDTETQAALAAHTPETLRDKLRLYEVGEQQEVLDIIVPEAVRVQTRP